MMHIHGVIQTASPLYCLNSVLPPLPLSPSSKERRKKSVMYMMRYSVCGGRPLNTLKLTGQFSLAEIHSWACFILCVMYVMGCSVCGGRPLGQFSLAEIHSWVCFTSLCV